MAGSKYVSGAPFGNYFATSAPTVNDDDVYGYAVGSQWAQNGVYGVYALYSCTNPTTGAAVWVHVI